MEQERGRRPTMVIILIIIVIIGILFCGIGKKKSSSSGNKNVSNYYNSNSRNNTTKSTYTHYCDASGCTAEGTYLLNGTSGKEYYCYKHYKQMEQWAEMIMGY